MLNDSPNQTPENDFRIAMRLCGQPPVLPPFGDAFEASQRPKRAIPTNEQLALAKLNKDEKRRRDREAKIRRRRRHFRMSVILFFATLASTTLVGDYYRPLEILMGFFNPELESRILAELNSSYPVATTQTPTLLQRFFESVGRGCTYSCPVMLILLCHEMGHYLQAVRNKVRASFPYFIPLPILPLGTMGAVIFQGKSDRKSMFDIAVSGPIAGLVVTLPVLYFGIQSSGFMPAQSSPFQFGQPLLIEWLIEFLHGPTPSGMVFAWNGLATAGWVGVFITAMNLLPIGQLDGGHLMYTLIGKAAHGIAWALIVIAIACLIIFKVYSYGLLLILLGLTGPRHPPTTDDRMKIGWFRHLLGWVTLSFLLIGFTPRPIVLPDSEPINAAEVLQSLKGAGEDIWNTLTSKK